MSTRLQRLAACVVLVGSVAVGRAADEVLLLVELADPPAEVVADTGDAATVEITVAPGTRTVPLEIEVVLVASFESCLASPGECTGSERQVGAQCHDTVDNDGDGKVDRNDPDCVGVQSYAIPVATDQSFQIRPEAGAEETRGVSFVGTVSDDASRPPGMVVPDTLCYVDVIDPARNGGQEGALAVCALSLTTFVILPPVGEWPILKLRGDLDVSTLEPGERGAPCRIDLRGPGEAGIGLGQPTTTVITVNGQNHAHAVRDLEIVAVMGPAVPFKRGDANSDGTLDVSDAVSILNYLFLGGRTPKCLDSADADDDGELLISDGIGVIQYLFYGSEALPSPGSSACGIDPTPDEVTCLGYEDC